ncbi:MAG: hypothetical protein JSS10_01345 [Verrucomicrobia bacterium]|nr:hypothetical protein [Verrucomicrobiota bacterium]
MLAVRCRPGFASSSCPMRAGQQVRKFQAPSRPSFDLAHFRAVIQGPWQKPPPYFPPAIALCPRRSFSEAISDSNNLVRLEELFQRKAPKSPQQPPILDPQFRQKASELVKAGTPLTDLSPEEKRAAGAFVSYDEDFQDKVNELLARKKPIEKLTGEERRVLEFYVNFDEEFRKIAQKVLWNDYPASEVDAIRALYVNFDRKFNEKILSLASLHFSREDEKQAVFLYVNYHYCFRNKARNWIFGAQDIDKLSLQERNELEIYIDLNKEFEERARELITGFRTHESLSELEKRIIKLYVNFNSDFRKKIDGWSDNPPRYQVGGYEKRFYNYGLLFNPTFREKTLQLMWGRRRFSDLLPSERNLVFWYVNCAEGFDKAQENTHSFMDHYHSRHLHGKKESLRTKQNYTLCRIDFLQKVQRVVLGEKKIDEFTPEEKETAKLYVHYSDEFQKTVRGLLTKPFEHLSLTEKRIFTLYFTFDDEFRGRMHHLAWSTKDLRDFTPEEIQLIKLYVNTESFQKQAAELISSKQEPADYSLKEERIAQLYVNFDTNFQTEAQKLVEAQHKKGGFYDLDAKLRYPKTIFSLGSPLTLFGISPKEDQIGEMNPFPTGISRLNTTSEPPPILEDFTSEEAITVKLYVLFHLKCRHTLQELIHKKMQQTAESKRIFHLAMWYDTEWRDKIFPLIWNSQEVEKMIKRSSPDYYWSREGLLDQVRSKKMHFSQSDWNYYFLGHSYYNVPIKPG